MSESTTGKTIDPNGVNHPKGYNSHPSGVETIEVIRHMPFNLGCAFKYVVRHQNKDRRKDLEKAVWYLADLISSPPSLAQIQTGAKVKHLIQEHILAEEDENAREFYGAVLGYVNGHGPANLVRAKERVQQLIAQQEGK